MPIKSSRLRVVGAKDDGANLVSTEINEALTKWLALEDRVATLSTSQDLEISQARIDKAKVEELSSIISNVEQEQATLLEEIASRPAKNLYDVVAKLQVWARVNVPVENEWVQPTDHLVASALSDLTNHIDES